MDATAEILHLKRCQGCGRMFRTPYRHYVTCGEPECQAGRRKAIRREWFRLHYVGAPPDDR